MAPFDLDACIDRLRDKQLLGEALLREICEKTKEVLMRESNVVHVSSPVTVVGDIHGQFHDLIEIFRIGGPAPNTNYLFLGALESELGVASPRLPPGCTAPTGGTAGPRALPHPNRPLPCPPPTHHPANARRLR
jgi:serine/threonine-protein phosphatase PPG1